MPRIVLSVQLESSSYKHNNYVPVDAQDKQINMFPLMRKVTIPKLLHVLLLDD